jgi:drug/metabolite transporter superfamily protein YnfA
MIQNLVAFTAAAILEILGCFYVLAVAPTRCVTGNRSARHTQSHRLRCRTDTC